MAEKIYMIELNLKDCSKIDQTINDLIKADKKLLGSNWGIIKENYHDIELVRKSTSNFSIKGSYKTTFYSKNFQITIQRESHSYEITLYEKGGILDEFWFSTFNKNDHRTFNVIANNHNNPGVKRNLMLAKADGINNYYKINIIQKKFEINQNIANYCIIKP